MIRLAAVCATVCVFAGGAAADPLPLPAVDFALKAKIQQGGAMELAHSGGRMRVHVSGPKVPTPVLGIVDIKRGKMLMMLPDIPKAAVEADLPPAYRTALPRGEGARIGEDVVAGEACDLFRIEKSQDVEGVAFVCITPDGIPLRTEIENKSKRQMVYEATSISRAPQPATLFSPPPGTQIMKVPPGAAGLVQGLGQFLGR